MTRTWLAALLFGLATLAAAEPWHLALIGDTPYSDTERQRFPEMLAAIDAAGVDVVAHIGDIKSGKAGCYDALLEDRKALFEASRAPFVLVPGDNEWTDCDRLMAGGYDPLERLAKLRSLFWASDRSLGRNKIILERQSAAYPEHARFRLGPVLFLTLNVPGGDNNWGPGDTPRPEHQARNRAILEWLHAGFALARRERLAGVAVLMQANPWLENFSRGLPHRAYKELLTALRDESEKFPGQVLLLHGDTHHQHVDRPLRDRRGKIMPRFTRVESYGYPFMGWVDVRIDPASPTLFEFTPHPWPPR